MTSLLSGGTVPLFPGNGNSFRLSQRSKLTYEVLTSSIAHFSSDIHICSRKIVGRIFVHIGQTSYISRLMDSLSQFQEICRSNPEICYPWTFWELSRELFVKVTCLLKIPWFIELVNIWNRRQSTEKSSKKLRVWNNVRVTPSGGTSAYSIFVKVPSISRASSSKYLELDS